MKREKEEDRKLPDEEQTARTEDAAPGAVPEGTTPPEGSGAAEGGPAGGGAAPSGEADAADGETGEGEQVFTFTRSQVEQMELAAKQLETVKDQFVRLTAEYENYRKRTSREKDALWQDARADTIKSFLGIYDDLERAAAAPGGEDSPHKKGLDMIFAKYRDLLKNMGVTEMDALGKPFDPERHNAVMHIEDEKFGENEVSQVFQAGFLLGDRVLRHAAVQVAN